MAEDIEHIMTVAESDGLMLMFPNYHADMLPFGESVPPPASPDQYGNTEGFLQSYGRIVVLSLTVIQ
ncbi:hypothetical protein J2S43_002968 [Catenuloplanes nepalensis]|uniref:Uncharacterized protein n=1 Tax=Catenuloplanes nepalensis TaxID=587533 RepID=A0ABT9MSP8_9ACTN|nr:hypothetical protein [Catenuloplanes nepalensis]MDP9794456.1 hypothetical protein [Catenuloplanes nepalensis]